MERYFAGGSDLNDVITEFIFLLRGKSVLDPCLKYYATVFSYACEVWKMKMMQVCNSKGK